MSQKETMDAAMRIAATWQAYIEANGQKGKPFSCTEIILASLMVNEIAVMCLENHPPEISTECNELAMQLRRSMDTPAGLLHIMVDLKTRVHHLMAGADRVEQQVRAAGIVISPDPVVPKKDQH